MQPSRLLCPWDSPGKNTGVGCHALLQGILPTQGQSLSLLHVQHWQAGLYHQHHLGSKKSLENTDKWLRKKPPCQPQETQSRRHIWCFMELLKVRDINSYVTPSLASQLKRIKDLQNGIIRNLFNNITNSDLIPGQIPSSLFQAKSGRGV